MTNRSIELHDSEVVDLTLDRDVVIIDLSAYVTHPLVDLGSTRGPVVAAPSDESNQGTRRRHRRVVGIDASRSGAGYSTHASYTTTKGIGQYRGRGSGLRRQAHREPSAVSSR